MPFNPFFLIAALSGSNRGESKNEATQWNSKGKK
jgi:hypothetical protein